MDQQRTSQTDGSVDRDNLRDGGGGGERRTGPRGAKAASRRQFLKATAGTGVALAGLQGITGSVAGGIQTPWLHRDGNKIKDPLDNEVILRGVNMADAKRIDVTSAARGKTATQVVEAATSEADGWQNQVIRLPLQPWDVAELPPVPMAWDMENPPDNFTKVGESNGYYEPPLFTEAELADYVEKHVVPVVEACVENDVYCIIDYHRHWGDGELAWAVGDQYGNPTGPYPPLDTEVKRFWRTIAPYFADVPNVLFEVYNEPTKPGWGPEDVIWNGWQSVCQPWVDIIRERAPRNLILIGSPRWCRMPWGIKYGEFEGDNLAYTYHVYPGHAVTDFDKDTGSAWEQAPLFVTEWGYKGGRCDWICGNEKRMGQPFKNWATERPVHWTSWCFDPVWLPNLVEREFQTDGAVDAIGNPYGGQIPEHCSSLPCDWVALDQDGDYAGQFVKTWLQEAADDRVPQVDYDPQPPEAPPNLSVTAVSQTSVEVSWDPVSDPGDSPFDYHVVTVDGRARKQVPADQTSATVADLLSDTRYEIGVLGVDVAGNRGEASTVVVTTDAFDDATAPGVPSDLAVPEKSHEQITLSWSGVTDTGPAGVHHYTVFVDGEARKRVPDGTTQATIDGLAPDTTYDLSVSAVDTSRNASARSASIAVTTEVDRPGEDAFLIHTFDERDAWPDGNCLGQKWTGSSGLTTAMSDGRIEIAYDGGWMGSKLNVDVTGYRYLKLRVAGADGGEQSQVTVSLGDLEAPLADVSPDPITTEMSVVTVDLADHPPSDVPAEFRLFFSGAGTIVLDDVWLDNVAPGDVGATPTNTPEDTPTDTPEDTPTDTPDDTPQGEPTWPTDPAPTDPDADGLYEDLTGNGEIDNQDVVRFFQNMGTQENPGNLATGGNTQFYDYTGNGAIDYQDLISLFGEIGT